MMCTFVARSFYNLSIICVRRGHGLPDVVPIYPRDCNMPRYLNLFLLSVMALYLGCAEPEQVQRYRIPKSRSDLGDIGAKKLSAPPTRAAEASPKTESRMFVAIDEKDDVTWFFKVTGSIEAVNTTEDQWKSILKSVEYAEAGNPDWTLPEDWKLGPPKPMRYATLHTSTDETGQVVLSISSLGPNQNLLNNVNRWRGQLGLEPIGDNELQLAKLSNTSSEMKVFDATGMLALTGAMARAAQGTRAVSPQANRPARPQRPNLKYDIPEGWIESNQSMMVPVRLRFGTDKSAPQITVTQLRATASEWIPNAQRWAGQVSMTQDEDTLKELTSEITVDGLTGQKVVLLPENEEAKIGMIGAMVKREDIAWFFKLIGDKKFVADNQEVFDQLMMTFKFE